MGLESTVRAPQPCQSKVNQPHSARAGINYSEKEWHFQGHDIRGRILCLLSQCRTASLSHCIMRTALLPV